jgi:hypothetical protein
MPAGSVAASPCEPFGLTGKRFGIIDDSRSKVDMDDKLSLLVVSAQIY